MDRTPSPLWRTQISGYILGNIYSMSAKVEETRQWFLYNANQTIVAEGWGASLDQAKIAAEDAFARFSF